MATPRKKRLTFDERIRSYEEQAQSKRQPPFPQRKLPTPRTCRIHFWQQQEDGPILIGYTPITDDGLLKSMRGQGVERAFRLAIIPYANTARETMIRERFSHLVVEPGTPFFHPTADLLDFIKTHASEWELPVKSPPRESKKSKLVERTCDGCGKLYRTGVGYRYCGDCQSVIKGRLYAEGYLQRVPHKTRINPDNAGAAHQGDPSPWGENAVKALEDPA